MPQNILRVNPDSLFSQPINPVSLPYDIPKLPTEQNILNAVRWVKEKNIAELDEIISNTQHSSFLEVDESLDRYKEWQMSVQRLNPGFSNTTEIMSPTRR